MINLQLRFHQKEVYFPSTYDFKLIEKDYKIYYNIEDYLYEDIKYKSITYSLVYIYNGAIGCCYSFFPQKKSLGFHEVDVEKVQILLDNNDKPKYVYFSAHGKEGKWYDWDKCERLNDNTLIVYVARASHANYPYSGTWWRIFGLANDLCSKNGRHIIPELVENDKVKPNPDDNKGNIFKKRFCLPLYL